MRSKPRIWSSWSRRPGARDMDRILELFNSSSTSLVPSPAASTHCGGSQSPTMVKSSLETLPAEILNHIFVHLDPPSLLCLSRTSQLLRNHAQNDLLWARFVRENVPSSMAGPFPCLSWKTLYIGHHPYWFLPRHKIWFSDKANTGSTMTGNVIIALYDQRQGRIEAYRLVAEHGPRTFHQWEWNPDVIIHTFSPKVRLWRDDPVVELHVRNSDGRGRSQTETRMPTGVAQGIRSVISLCQIIPDELQDESMALWPPAICPAPHRVRNESPTMFRGEATKPRTMAQASDSTFRIRKWVEFGSMGVSLGVRVGEDVMTFGTLSEESYIPTEEKPWQGIWVGDYAGHGCEFLVVLQKDVESLAPDNDLDHHSGEAVRDGSCTGRLEAIKLTGDPHVPRGEYTWIAEDIGHKGLIRIADEDVFKGARIVKSRGNTAARGYQSRESSVARTIRQGLTTQTATYISSQLIMISHNSLAQYWEVSSSSWWRFRSTYLSLPCRSSGIYRSIRASTSMTTWTSDDFAGSS